MNLPVTMHRLPMLATQNVVLYPGRSIPLVVGRKQSVNSLKRAAATNSDIVIVAQKAPTQSDEIDLQNIYKFGTRARVERLIGNDETGFQAVITGLSRVSYSHIDVEEEGLFAHIFDVADEESPSAEHEQALITNLRAKSIEILKLIPADTRQIIQLISSIDALDRLTYLCAENLDASLATQ